MDSIGTIAMAGPKSFGIEVKAARGPVNVLIGANGSGNSGFLRTFACLKAPSSGCAHDVVSREGGADQVHHLGWRNTERLTICAKLANSDGYYLCLNQDGLVLGMPELPGKDDERRSTIDRSGSWHCYHFLDTGLHSPMRKISKPDDNANNPVMPTGRRKSLRRN